MTTLRQPYPMEVFAEFARLHVESEDIDPVYPVLRHLLHAEHEGYAREDSDDSLARTFTYLAYYNLASAETAWGLGLRPDAAHWMDADHPVLRFPTATERRGLRGGAPLQKHLASLSTWAAEAGGFKSWLYADLAAFPDPTLRLDPLVAEMTGERNWDRIGPRLGAVWGNGRWALYKAREVLWKVNGLPLRAPDTGMANSTGPRDGLALVKPEAAAIQGNAQYHIELLEDMAWDLRHELADDHGLPLGIEQVETVLCDFKAMAHGRYYVGHDIDQMLEQVSHPSVSAEARDRILDARRRRLPEAYLGELHGRRGVDKARCRAFADTGVILARG